MYRFNAISAMRYRPRGYATPEASLGQRKLGGRRLRGLLREALQCEQYVRAPSFRREEDPECLMVAVCPNLVDVAAKVPCDGKAVPLDILHRRHDLGGITVREGADEVLHGSATRSCPVVAPPSLPGRFGGH